MDQPPGLQPPLVNYFALNIIQYYTVQAQSMIAKGWECQDYSWYGKCRVQTGNRPSCLTTMACAECEEKWRVQRGRMPSYLTTMACTKVYFFISLYCFNKDIKCLKHV